MLMVGIGATPPKAMKLAQTLSPISVLGVERRSNLNILMMIAPLRPAIPAIPPLLCSPPPHGLLHLADANLGQAEQPLHKEEQDGVQNMTGCNNNMKNKRKTGIEEYQDLLTELKEFGPYQIRLIAVMMLYWFLSGINDGIFELSLAWAEVEWEFYAEETVQFINMLVFTYLSLYISRYYVNLIIIAILTVGCVMVVVGVFAGVGGLKEVGVFVIVTFHYSLAFNLLMINLEFHCARSYSKIWMLALLGLTIGRLTSVSIASTLEDEAETAYKVVLPGCLLYILTSLLYFQSPRFLIDQHFERAESLMKLISEINHVRQENITVILQRQFFWNKVNLQKYSVLTLFRYGSISYNTYLLTVSTLLLGIICRCPDFIQHLQSNTSFKVEDSVEIIWISVFQLCGLFISYVASFVLRRRHIEIALAIILLLISGLLALLDQSNFSIGDAVLYSMAIFGLNSFFSMALFYFLILSSIEFFPHTIRTLSCGLIMSAQKLGRMLFSLHIELIGRNAILLELVVCCSLLLLIHSFLIEQTLDEPGKYEISQIEQKENEDF